MADELLGEMLGEEDEKPEDEAADALAGAEAFASAVAAKLAGNDPGVARKTEIFLDKQAHLLEIQAEHLNDEHALRLDRLRGQAREGKLREWRSLSARSENTSGTAPRFPQCLQRRRPQRSLRNRPKSSKFGG